MAVKVENVRIAELLSYLARLSLNYDAVDIIVDEVKRTIMLKPIAPEIKAATIIRLSDDDIDKLI